MTRRIARHTGRALPSDMMAYSAACVVPVCVGMAMMANGEQGVVGSAPVVLCWRSKGGAYRASRGRCGACGRGLRGACCLADGKANEHDG